MRPASDRLPEVAVVLADFNREVLSFHKDPSRFLRAETTWLAQLGPGDVVGDVLADQYGRLSDYASGRSGC